MSHAGIFGRTLHHATLLPYMAPCDILLFPKLKVKSYRQENVIRQLMVVLEGVLAVCFEKVKDTGHFKDIWLPLLLVCFLLCMLILDDWLFSKQSLIYVECEFVDYIKSDEQAIKLNLDFEKIELQISSCTSDRMSFGNQFWMRPSSKKQIAWTLTLPISILHFYSSAIKTFSILMKLNIRPYELISCFSILLAFHSLISSCLSGLLQQRKSEPGWCPVFVWEFRYSSWSCSYTWCAQTRCCHSLWNWFYQKIFWYVFV